MADRFILRRADITDVDALSQLCQKTFLEAFIEDLCIPYPQKDLDSFLNSYANPESFVKKINDPKQAVWVIEDTTSNELVAYAVAGPCDTNDIPHPDACADSDGVINRIYVRRNQQGQRFGQQLMNVILSWLEEQYPGRPIWLPVLSGNIKAQKFYKHYGFNKVYEYYYPIGEWKDLDFIMKRDAKTL